ncbi:hypothetical protein ACKWTF_013991 [Chironomus riparius]
MERKPLQVIKELQRKNSELERTKSRLEYQIQEMITKSAQRSAEMDQKLTELEIKIRDLEYENRELISDRREMKKKIVENAATSTQSGDVIDLDSNDEDAMEEEDDHDHEESNLLEPLQSQPNQENYGEQRTLPYTCNICSKSYLYQKRLETHMKIHQNVTKTSAKLLPKSEPKVKADKKKNFVCNVKDCGYSTTFYPVMVRHKKAHTSELLSCDFYMCDYKTPYRKRYFNHMANKHGASLPNVGNGNDGQDDDEDEEQFSVFTDLNSHLISSSMQDMDMGGNVKSRLSY